MTTHVKHCFNPLDKLDPTSADCVSESAAIADALVIMDHKSNGDHFDESAKTLLHGLMLHVVASCREEERNLAELRRLLTAETDKFLKRWLPWQQMSQRPLVCLPEPQIL